MRLIGLDVGRARVGVAASDETGTLAFARGAVVRRGGQRDIDAIARMAAAEGAEEVVVGLPYNADGSEGAQAAATRRFAERVAAATALPVVYHDERYSSVEAAEAMRAAGVDGRKIRDRIDAEAARIILQGYIDERRGDA